MSRGLARILAGWDISPAGDNGLAHAVAWACGLGLPLQIFHASPRSNSLNAAQLRVFEKRRALRTQLSCKAEVVVGRATRKLAEAVSHGDLVVLGRSKRAAGDTSLGNVTLTVLRETSASVLIVPETCESDRASAMSNVVIGVDLIASNSPHLETASGWLSRMGRPKRHLVNGFESGIDDIETASGEVKREVEESRRAVVRRIHERARDVRTPDWDVVCHVCDDSPENAICQIAQATRAELVIVGRPAKERLLDPFRDSIAEAVAGRSYCPTLVMRGRPGPCSAQCEEFVQ